MAEVLLRVFRQLKVVELLQDGCKHYCIQRARRLRWIPESRSCMPVRALGDTGARRSICDYPSFRACRGELAAELSYIPDKRVRYMCWYACHTKSLVELSMQFA